MAGIQKFTSRTRILKKSCSKAKLLNSHQKLYEFCHFSICCSQYHFLFKKPKLRWNSYVLVENERSVWDPAGISSCGPCPCLLLKKPVVVFAELYLSNLMTKFINFFQNKPYDPKNKQTKFQLNRLNFSWVIGKTKPSDTFQTPKISHFLKIGIKWLRMDKFYRLKKVNLS